MNELTMIPIGLLYPHPNNPRKDVEAFDRMTAMLPERMWVE